MPANLTPQYLAAEERYRQAITPAEKLASLEEMYALIPKHKGTEKMRADIRKKISQAKAELHQAKSVKHHDPSAIPREGAGRVVLVGPPNAGKSAILKAMTNAEPKIAPYEFTTRLPELGMVEWEDVQFQMVDLPAVNRQYMESWVMSIIRSANLLFLVVDQSSPGVLEEIEEQETILTEHKIYLHPSADDLCPGGITQPYLLILNKMDLPGSESNALAVEEIFNGRHECLHLSAETGMGVPSLKRRIFEKLQLVRVYTKIPGKPPDRDHPYVLKTGSILIDLCGVVHKDFLENLKFARIWGESKFEGQRVNRDYVLMDGDIVELHI